LSQRVAMAVFPELAVLHNSNVNASRGREGVSLYDVYPCVVQGTSPVRASAVARGTGLPSNSTTNPE
jgi:hypothetical protein